MEADCTVKKRYTSKSGETINSLTLMESAKGRGAHANRPSRIDDVNPFSGIHCNAFVT